MSYPPEPWTPMRYGNIDYQASDTISIEHDADGTVIQEVEHHTARRICACVNALEGVPTDQLEKVINAAKKYSSTHTRLVMLRVLLGSILGKES